MARMYLYLLMFLLPYNVHAEIANNQSHPKNIVSEIVKHDPFPHKETKKRWTIDIENSFDLDKDSEPNEIAKYIIVMIAAVMEYILWILLAIAVVLIYLNRKLFLFENIKSFRLKSKKLTTKTKTHEPSIMFDNILTDVQKLYDQGQVRDSIRLLYNAFIKKINDMDIDVSTSLTEKEVYSLISTHSQSMLPQLAAKLIYLRSKTAYQQKTFSKDELNSVCSQWKQVFSNEN